MDIDIRHLVYQLLPVHKRLPFRLAWLGALLQPLCDLWVRFASWRTDTRLLINVNSQAAVLEGFLNLKYNKRFGIKIESYYDGLIFAPRSDEAEGNHPEIHSDAAEEPALRLPHTNEIRERFGDDTDFVIYIPADIDKTLVQADIDRYKQALVEYKIIQQ